MSRLFGIASIILTALLAYQYTLLRDVTARALGLTNTAEAVYVARLSLYTRDSMSAVAALKSGASDKAIDLLQNRIWNDVDYLKDRIDLVPDSMRASITETLQQAETLPAESKHAD